MGPSYARVTWRVIAGVITVGAVVWVLLLISRAWPDLAAHAEQISVWYLLLGMLLLAASAYPVFLVFALLARATGVRGLDSREIAHLYFSSQLLKHLPGRVWGIGYQWASGPVDSPFGHWLFVNASHMGLATYFALWSSALVIATVLWHTWSIAVLAVGCLLFAAGWTVIRSTWVQRVAAGLPGRVAPLASGGVRVLSSIRARQQWKVFLLLVAGSIVYYMAWAAFGAGYGRVGWIDGVFLGAIYLIAWFVGYASLLAPSGIGVRELVFAWLASEFPPDQIAMMAIVGRVAMLVADVILGVMFLPFVPKRS